MYLIVASKCHFAYIQETVFTTYCTAYNIQSYQHCLIQRIQELPTVRNSNFFTDVKIALLI
jgi:hypothetical protein